MRYKPSVLTLINLALLGLLAPASSAAAGDPFTRVVEKSESRVVLQMATHTLVPVSGQGPTIHLVSAIHIADAPFYEAMQEQLDTYDTVLFEGVKPAGLNPIDPELPDPAKADATRSRLELLLDIADHYHSDSGSLPGAYDDLRTSDDARIAAMVASLDTDAWGHPISLTLVDTTIGTKQSQIITFTSLGADGQLGGTGPDEDITLSSQPYTPDQPGKARPEGIQTQLANALRVEFQLDIMDTTNPGWINADMDITQLQHAMAAEGQDDAQILKMLEGDSLSAKIVGFVLGFVSRSPKLSSMMKLVLMDMLSLAETTDMMAQQEALNKVIVHDRNAVVIDYLKDTLRDHPDYHDIGIFYGAGHMPGLESSILDMGYTLDSTSWSTAMTVDTTDTGLSTAQVKMMRNMIKNSIEKQFGN